MNTRIGKRQKKGKNQKAPKGNTKKQKNSQRPALQALQ